MKSSLLRTFFEWALITSILMSVGFFAWYYFRSHALRAYNSQIATAQTHLQYNHNVMGVLMSECEAYAKTNADMARLLAPASAPTATNKPGTK
jgi:hypothetical protein